MQTVYVWRSSEARSCDHCWCRKTISVTYSECVFVALVIQNAMSMLHIVVCGLLSNKRQDFRKNLLNMKCVFWFSVQICLKHFLFQEEVSDTWSKICIGLHVKYRYSGRIFCEIWIFSAYFRKIFKYKISWKAIRWVSSCSMLTDGRTWLN